MKYLFPKLFGLAALISLLVACGATPTPTVSSPPTFVIATEFLTDTLTDAVTGTPCAQPVPTTTGEYIISGTVWNDTDKNGKWDHGEQAVSYLSATIKLKNSKGRTVQTVRVDCEGGYVFHNLPSGTYSLSPSFTPTNAGQLKNISIGPDIFTVNIGYKG